MVKLGSIFFVVCCIPNTESCAQKSSMTEMTLCRIYCYAVCAYSEEFCYPNLSQMEVGTGRKQNHVSLFFFVYPSRFFFLPFTSTVLLLLGNDFWTKYIPLCGFGRPFYAVFEVSCFFFLDQQALKGQKAFFFWMLPPDPESQTAFQFCLVSTFLDPFRALIWQSSSPGKSTK